MSASVSSAPTLLSVSPINPGGLDLEATLAFYQQKLGFRIVYRDATPATFAVIARDEATVLLQRSDDKHWAEQTSFRVAVRNVDALHREFAQRGANPGKLETKPWGTYEFHQIDPAGVCLHFYEPEEPAK